MSEGLIERYERDGYLAMEDLVSRSEVTELREEAEKLCLEKGGALARDSGAASSDPLAAYLAIHFPHKLSSRFRAALAHPRIVEALTSLIGPNIKCMQSMLFIKHAGKPGQAWHQDEDFIPTRDRSLTAAWIALDDATIDNGCLWAIPGSHRSGVLWPLRRHVNPEYEFDSGIVRFSLRRKRCAADRGRDGVSRFLQRLSLAQIAEEPQARRLPARARQPLHAGRIRCFRGGGRVDLIRRPRICATSFSLRAPIPTPREATKT